eukprot:CAMPEP_0196586508 /NCGR_PEP_ID=MMETSP1081-20130531/54530_1 /TAXON_ID=36882 /ORGANISM="Pyramimonas amylifera, Strain CCMP720" /LENGTH=60 /DNA_ID=CAMNT_0041908415 /DNA_START=703 /DNA_END=885 /DNA_ORIENTATION=+
MDIGELDRMDAMRRCGGSAGAVLEDWDLWMEGCRTASLEPEESVPLIGGPAGVGELMPEV